MCHHMIIGLSPSSEHPEISHNSLYKAYTIQFDNQLHKKIGFSKLT